MTTQKLTFSARSRVHLAVAAVLGVAAAALPAASAWAQSAYPAKPIRLIVPFPPGGGTDMIARTVAQKVADKHKWSIVIDNRPGAGGNIAAAAVGSTPTSCQNGSRSAALKTGCACSK